MDILKPQIPEYTVGELVNSIKTVLEGAFGYLKVVGEVGSCKMSSNGHLYFNLKDSQTMINVVLFKNVQNSLILEDGLNIAVYGKLSTYKERSNYQIIAERIEVNGEGQLLKLLEERKAKLKAKGLFETSHKRAIASIITRAGIITSPTGAAIHDIMARMKDRLPINFELYPSLVQGMEAEDNIIRGLEYFNGLKDKPQVVIITRGGGSTEDLMCFNGEKLAEAIYNSAIPVISAVGHEIDWTICDYVADLRLPTPTAVAEHIAPLKESLLDKINSLFRTLATKMSRKYHSKRQKISSLFKAIFYALADNYTTKQRKLAKVKIRLQSLDINRYFARGFALLKKQNKVLKKAEDINIEDELQITFFHKKLTVKVLAIENL